MPPIHHRETTMKKLRRKRFGLVAAGLVASAVIGMPRTASADEGGVSFWIPGFFGSLAATPQQPGWSVATIYYHTSVSAGGDVAFARQVTRGRLTANFTGNLAAELDADVDLAMLIPSYVFAKPVLGGQLSVSLLGLAGRNDASVDATLTGLGPLGLSISRGRSDAVTGFGDLIPQAALRWTSPATSRSAPTTRADWPTSALATGRWTVALATPTFQSEDRQRILVGARLHLQSRKPAHRLPERH